MTKREITHRSQRFSWFPLNSLRIRLFLFVLLLVVPALMLILVNAAKHRERDAAEAEENALRFARLAASTQEQQIAAGRQLLSALAQFPAVRSRDSANCNPYFADLLTYHPQYSNISVVALDGEDFFCSSIPANPGTNVLDRAWFQRTIEARDFAVGNFVIGRTTNVPSISFGYPVFDNAGELMGVAVVSTHLDWLSAWLGQIDLPSRSTLTVTDSNGTVLASHPYQPELIGQPLPEVEIFETITARQTGTLTAVDPDSEKRLYGFTTLSDLAGRIYVVVGISEAVALEQANELQNFLLISLLAGTAILLLVGWIGASRLIVDPIDSLIIATERLAAGDLTARLQPVPISELDRLATSVNQLAVALDQRASEVRGYTAELQNEIEGRKQTEAQLHDLVRLLAAEIEARRAAEQSDERKLRFLAMVSHELRTPLTSIKGFAATLLAKDVMWDSDSQTDFIQTIDEEADVLLEMIEQLLDLAQIEAGTFRIQQTASDLSDVFNEAQPRFNTVATKHRLQWRLPDDLISVNVDKRRIRQVLMNLIVNAVKYSPEETTITVSAQLSEGRVRINVQDEGAGIHPDEQPNIFRAFQRGADQSAGAKGAGLGLAICKGIIEAHGGRVWLESSSADGSTFSFEVPLAPLEVA
ncbi:MAG: HAMP domain-containing protein [Burkholderiales bacterium]|nr:HAMP domain-containing protein [Anaerolineae bacterium]